MRCSQPLTGTSGRRCKEDERLVNAVLTIGRRGYIVDTRSQAYAKAELKAGKMMITSETEVCHMTENFLCKR